MSSIRTLVSRLGPALTPEPLQSRVVPLQGMDDIGRRIRAIEREQIQTDGEIAKANGAHDEYLHEYGELMQGLSERRDEIAARLREQRTILADKVRDHGIRADVPERK
jgi:hypothetical protein